MSVFGNDIENMATTLLYLKYKVSFSCPSIDKKHVSYPNVVTQEITNIYFIPADLLSTLVNLVVSPLCARSPFQSFTLYLVNFLSHAYCNHLFGIYFSREDEGSQLILQEKEVVPCFLKLNYF